MAKIIFMAFLVACFVTLKVNGQGEEEPEVFKNHRISLVIGHTHVPAGNPEVGRSGSVIVPSWGLDYEYWFTHRWAAGFHTDLELVSYVVDNEERQELEREQPVIISIVGLFKPIPQLVLYMGPGVELEQNESFFVYRFGLEYEFEFGDHWDLSPGIFYDNKQGVYDAWAFGLAVGKRL